MKLLPISGIQSQRPSGYVLVTALLLILITATLSATGLQTALIETAMAANRSDRQDLFRRAESALTIASTVTMSSILQAGEADSFTLSIVEVIVDPADSTDLVLTNPIVLIEKISPNPIFRLSVSVTGAQLSNTITLTAVYDYASGAPQRLSWKKHH